MKQESIAQNIESCGLCLKILSDPVTLPCLDSFCLACLESYQFSPTPACPCCQTTFFIPGEGLRAMPYSKFTEKVLMLHKICNQNVDDRLCDICCPKRSTNEAGAFRLNLAEKFCLECQQKFCINCLEYHTRMKCTSFHQVVKLGIESSHNVQQVQKEKDQLCPIHSVERVQVQCISCDVLVCRLCHEQNHLAHECVWFTNQIKIDTQQKIEGKREILICSLIERQDKIKRMEYKLSTRETEIFNIRQNVTQKVTKLKEAIDKYEQQLRQDLDNYYTVNVSGLQTEVEEKKNVVSSMMKLERFMQELTEKGSDSNLVQFNATLCQRSDNLLNATFTNSNFDESRLLFLPSNGNVNVNNLIGVLVASSSSAGNSNEMNERALQRITYAEDEELEMLITTGINTEQQPPLPISTTNCNANLNILIEELGRAEDNVKLYIPSFSFNANAVFSGSDNHTVEEAHTLNKDDANLIKVNKDGSCFFRCVAVHVHKVLQRAKRYMFGEIKTKMFKQLERILSEKIRDEVVTFLRSRKDIISHYIESCPFLLDRIEGQTFASIDERISHMSHWWEHAGYLEIIAVAYLVKTSVHVYVENGDQYKLIAKLPNKQYSQRDPICVLYEMDTETETRYFDLLPLKNSSPPSLSITSKSDNILSLYAEYAGNEYKSIVFESLFDTTNQSSGICNSITPSMSSTRSPLGKQLNKSSANAVHNGEENLCRPTDVKLTEFLYKPTLLYVIRLGHVDDVVEGMVILGNELFVVVGFSSTICVYNTSSFTLIRRMKVSIPDSKPEKICFIAISACEHNHCLYICDDDNVIYRCRPVRSNNVINKWTIDGTCTGLSVTTSYSLLVTLHDKLVKEYTSIGDIIREISLDSSIKCPCYCIQQSSDLFVVSDVSYDQSRVCLIDANGRIVQSYGGSHGSVIGEMKEVSQMTVDKHGNVMIANWYKDRVELLSPTLTHLGYIRIPGYKLCGPGALHFDEINHRLYIADGDGDRVLVLNANG